MGKWVGTFITEDGTEFTPARQDGVWQIGNDEYHQKVFGEFVDALRERGDMPSPPGILSRQAFKEIQAQLQTDLGILTAFIRDNLDLSEPPNVAAAIQRFFDSQPEDDEPEG